MRAIGVIEYGGPEVLQQVELPDPKPASGEVLVSVRAAAVNPVDVLLCVGALDGWYAGLKPPFIPGMDAAGTIAGIGADVDPALGLEVGQSVAVVINSMGQVGGYGEQVVVPAESVVAIPEGADFPHAASFLMNALAAQNALDTAALQGPSTVLVTGAAGALGTYAVALAHAAGHRVIAIASASDEATLREQGADEFMVRGDDAAARVLALAPAGVDVVIDAAMLGESIVPAVSDNGVIVNLRGQDASFERGISMAHSNVRERMGDHAAIVNIRELVNDGVMPMQVATTYPWTNATAAHQRLAEGGLRGRLILEFPASID